MRRDWLFPALLSLFAILPLIPGAMRLVELSGGPQILLENPRATAAPVPVVLHIVTAFFYTVLGAWQFSPALRRTAWHRRVGRLLAPLGLGAALSGLYLTLAFPTAPEYDATLLVPVRLMVSSYMALAIGLALRAVIMRRDLPAHRDWMLRAYALGLGAATQLLVFIPTLPFGAPGPAAATLLLSSGWLINLAIAEWIIQRSRLRRPALAAG